MKIGPGEIFDPPVIEPITVLQLIVDTAAATTTETVTAPPMSTTITATVSLIRKRGQNSKYEWHKRPNDGV